MNNILVPTDFSEAAKSAAIYAVHFAKQLHVGKIVLYNAYQQPVATDANMTPVELIDFDEIREISNKGLENFKTAILPYAASDVAIETLSEYTILTEGLHNVCETHKIDVIVMGVTGGGKLDEALIGSNAVTVAKRSTVPVIIVPPGVSFSDIKNVMLACDFKKVIDTTPVKPIKQILDETKAKLFILNIDHENKNFSADTPFESLMLDTLFYGYAPEYHFVDSTDFVEGINNFAVDKNIDLIITIPKKHGFFESLFKTSHTKKLAFHSHVPLMVIHD
jgi:nucleotide-binding universal stress UspA family protein